MTQITTVIIGAGQCGLAMSHALSRRGIGHVVLERGRIGNSWYHERWNGLRLLTPNFLNPLPGLPCDGADWSGFMPACDFAARVTRSASLIGAPVHEETEVRRVTASGGTYRIDTGQEVLTCDSVVLATGACATPRIPAFAADLPGDIHQTAALTYTSPDALPDGPVLVVGAAASGLNIARDLRLSGREVTLAVGSHMRLPRDYRGTDILTWATIAGILTEDVADPADLTRLRHLPSLPLLGDPSRSDLSLNALQDIGVEVTGRLAAIRDGRALFSGGLASQCTSADLKMNRLLDRIDTWIDDAGLDLRVAPADRFTPTRIDRTPRLDQPLSDFSAIVWATGYRASFPWLDLPVFDPRGALRHSRGKVAPGLYALGQKYLRNARSTHIAGAIPDAETIARHLVKDLKIRAAA